MTEAPWQKSLEYLAYQWYLAIGGTVGVPGESPWQKSLTYWLWQIAVLYGDTSTHWNMPVEYWLYRIYVLNGGTATNWQKPAEYWARLIYGQLSATTPIANFNLEYWLYEISQNATPPAVPWYQLSNKFIVAYQPKGAVDYATSKVNLITPGTHDALEGDAPAWAALTGWTFDGVFNHLFVSGLVHAVDQTWSMIIQFNSQAGGDRTICGSYRDSSGDNAFALQASQSGEHVYFNGATTGRRALAPVIAAGNLCIAGRQGYLNGVANGAPVPVGVGAGTVNTMAIGCLVFNAGVFQFDSVVVTAFGVCDDTLTAPELAAIVPAMAAI